VEAKEPKTMLAVAWPFVCPAQFTDSFGLAQDRPGGGQICRACPERSRRAQAVLAFFPVTVARLGHATRPGTLYERKGKWIADDDCRG